MSDGEFRVWIGCLGCYNGGDLIGQWFDADGCPQDMQEFWDAYLKSADFPPSHVEERHEELWVMDLDNAPRGCHHEMSPMDAQAIADRINELHFGDNLDAYAAWCDSEGFDFVDADVADFEESYSGEFESREDFAQELADELGAIPEDYSWPTSYIDWNGAARDLFMSDYFDVNSPNGIYVFRHI